MRCAYIPAAPDQISYRGSCGLFVSYIRSRFHMKTTSSQTPDIRASALSGARSIPLWAGLILVSGVPRILGAFLLPNAFGDAYSYLETIEAMRSKMADGTFAIKDLYGFWLTQYPFIYTKV